MADRENQPSDEECTEEETTAQSQDNNSTTDGNPGWVIHRILEYLSQKAMEGIAIFQRYKNLYLFVRNMIGLKSVMAPKEEKEATGTDVKDNRRAEGEKNVSSALNERYEEETIRQANGNRPNEVTQGQADVNSNEYSFAPFIRGRPEDRPLRAQEQKKDEHQQQVPIIRETESRVSLAFSNHQYMRNATKKLVEDCLMPKESSNIRSVGIDDCEGDDIPKPTESCDVLQDQAKNDNDAGGAKAKSKEETEAAPSYQLEVEDLKASPAIYLETNTSDSEVCQETMDCSSIQESSNSERQQRRPANNAIRRIPIPWDWSDCVNLALTPVVESPSSGDLHFDVYIKGKRVTWIFSEDELQAPIEIDIHAKSSCYSQGKMTQNEAQLLMNNPHVLLKRLKEHGESVLIPGCIAAFLKIYSKESLDNLTNTVNTGQLEEIMTQDLQEVGINMDNLHVYFPEKEKQKIKTILNGKSEVLPCSLTLLIEDDRKDEDCEKAKIITLFHGRPFRLLKVTSSYTND